MRGGAEQPEEERALTEEQVKDSLLLATEEYYKQIREGWRMKPEYRASEEQRSKERLSKERLQAEYDRLQSELGVSASLRLSQEKYQGGDRHETFDPNVEGVIGTINGHLISIPDGIVDDTRISGDEDGRKMLDELRKRYINLARIGQVINLIQKNEEAEKKKVSDDRYRRPTTDEDIKKAKDIAKNLLGEI